MTQVRAWIGGVLLLGAAVPARADPAPAAIDPTVGACLSRYPRGSFTTRELLPGRRFLTFTAISPQHRKEWEASAVAAPLIDGVLVSLPDVGCEPAAPLSRPLLAYLGLADAELPPALERTGWLVRQLDPLTLRPVPSQVKLDAGHRRGRAKYEDVAGGAPEIGYLAVPDAIAARVYRRHGLRDAGGAPFWQVVRARRLPLVLTEGAKKAAALLSAGHAAVSLPGVCQGISLEDEAGRSHEPRLRPGLSAMLAAGTRVTFAFDHDDTPNAQKFVRTTLVHTALAVQRAGAQVWVIELPGPEKGVDDFIAARGAAAFDELYARAQRFEPWLAAHPDIYPVQALLEGVGGCR